MLSYLSIVLMAGIVGFMAIAAIFTNQVLGPRNPYPRKLSPWECGMEPVGDASTGQFRVQYFVIAILFIVFDVEVLYLFPWAVLLADKTISVFLFVEMVVFLAILAVGLVYAWAKGALDWV